MNELQKHERDSERLNIESVQQIKQEKELKYDNSIVPHKGHKVFEVNTITREVKEATFAKEEIIDLTKWEEIKKSSSKKKIQKNKNCVYISALNKLSALKRFDLGKGSAVIKTSNERL